MIAVDTNLLVYALREDSPFHAAALRVVAELAGSGRRWAIPWPCVHEFLAIATHPRIYSPPTPIEVACAALDAWFRSPMLELLGEGPGYWSELRRLASAARLSGPSIHDARIAALCIHHGVSELWSADRDFSRYPRLVVRNPLPATPG